MKQIITVLMTTIMLIGTLHAESVLVPPGYNANKLMRYWVRHHTVHTNINNTTAYFELWVPLERHNMDGSIKGVELRNIGLAAFPRLADLTNSVAAAEAEWGSRDKDERAPVSRWAGMTDIQKAQWYSIYLLGKTGGIPNTWTFKQFLAYVKANVVDITPWESEGLP